MPAISVITIVKNNEKLLPRAVGSVLAQRFKDFEYIIVNDGSTDGTGAIIDEYAAKDKRVNPKHMPQNVGRAMARNAGMDEAKGRYLFFLDADDYLPDTSFLDLYQVADSDNADIVFGRFKCFDQLSGDWLQNHYTYKIINQEKHGIRLDDHLDLVDYTHIVGRLFRREMLERNKIRFSTKRKNGEDVPFAFFTSFYAESISMIPKKTVYYYSLGNYLAAATESKLFDARDNFLDNIEFALTHGSDSLKNRMLQKGVMFAGSLERAQKVYEGDDENFRKYLTTLVPFVKGATEAVLSELPPYYQDFARALQAYNFGDAFLRWTQRNGHTSQKGPQTGESAGEKVRLTAQHPGNVAKDNLALERLRIENKKLAHQLDRLYNSWSWRITAPLRRITRPLRRKGNKQPSSAKSALSAPKPVILKPGLDLSLNLQTGGFGQHRSGWNYAVHSLKSLHNPEGLYLVSFLEKFFVWGKPRPIEFPRPWIGFAHRPHNIPEWFPEDMRRQFYQNEYFQDVLPSCRGIFTLSEYHARHLSQKLSVPVESLIHPTEIPEHQWDPEALSGTKKIKVVQVGYWLRNQHGIFMLPSGNYEKIYLTKRNLEESVARIFSIEGEYLKEKGLFSDSMYDTARTVDFLPNDEYDSLLASCIIFLELYDASANNAIIEGIARATPILVNPLEPIVEYLGEEYPLYYNSYEEAVEKLHDRNLLHDTHEYLKNCPIRGKLTGSYFKNSLEKSKIYLTCQ